MGLREPCKLQLQQRVANVFLRILGLLKHISRQHFCTIQMTVKAKCFLQVDDAVNYKADSVFGAMSVLESCGGAIAQ